MKKVIVYIIIVVSLLFISFGLYYSLISKSNTNKGNSKQKDINEKSEEVIFLQDGENYNDAVRRLCTTILKKAECKTGEIVEENGLYSITVDWDKNYYKRIDISFSNDSYIIGSISKNDTQDISNSGEEIGK